MRLAYAHACEGPAVRLSDTRVCVWRRLRQRVQSAQRLRAGSPQPM